MAAPLEDWDRRMERPILNGPLAATKYDMGDSSPSSGSPAPTRNSTSIVASPSSPLRVRTPADHVAINIEAVHHVVSDVSLPDQDAIRPTILARQQSAATNVTAASSTTAAGRGVVVDVKYDMRTERSAPPLPPPVFTPYVARPLSGIIAAALAEHQQQQQPDDDKADDGARHPNHPFSFSQMTSVDSDTRNIAHISVPTLPVVELRLPIARAQLDLLLTESLAPSTRAEVCKRIVYWAHPLFTKAVGYISLGSGISVAERLEYRACVRTAIRALRNCCVQCAEAQNIILASGLPAIIALLFDGVMSPRFTTLIPGDESSTLTGTVRLSLAQLLGNLCVQNTDTQAEIWSLFYPTRLLDVLSSKPPMPVLSALGMVVYNCIIGLPARERDLFLEYKGQMILIAMLSACSVDGKPDDWIALLSVHAFERDYVPAPFQTSAQGDFVPNQAPY